MSTETTPLLQDDLSNEVSPRESERRDHAPSASNSPGDLEGLRLLSRLIFVWLGSFLAALDATMTSTMSARIATDFGSISLVAVLGSSYLVANAAVQPLTGRLTDIFGRRSGFLFSTAAFIIGNFLCGIAPNQASIIAGRAVAGIGGGGLNSIATFVGNDLVPSRRRGLWMGIGMMTYSAGIALGGVLGGFISDALTWRWAFFVLCPATALVAIGGFFTISGPSLKPSAVDKDRSFFSQLGRVDFLGSALLVTALVALLFGLDYEKDSTLPSNDAGTSSQLSLVPIVLLPAAALAFVAFLLVEKYVAANPVIPIPLLTNRTVISVYFASLFASAALYSLIFHIPLYLQSRGFSTTASGALLVAEPVGIALGCLIAGALMRITGDYVYLKPAVLVIFLGGGGSFVLNQWDTWIGWIEAALFLNGLGFGGISTTLLLALLSAINHSDQAIATGGNYAFRTVGGSVGIAMSGLAFKRVLGDVGGGSSTSSGGLDELPLGGCNQLLDGQDLAVCIQYHKALKAAFLVALGCAVLALVCGLCGKNYPLKSSFEEAKPDVEDQGRRCSSQIEES